MAARRRGLSEEEQAARAERALRRRWRKAWFGLAAGLAASLACGALKAWPTIWLLWRGGAVTLGDYVLLRNVQSLIILSIAAFGLTGLAFAVPHAVTRGPTRLVGVLGALGSFLALLVLAALYLVGELRLTEAGAGG